MSLWERGVVDRGLDGDLSLFIFCRFHIPSKLAGLGQPRGITCRPEGGSTEKAPPSPPGRRAGRGRARDRVPERGERPSSRRVSLYFADVVGGASAAGSVFYYRA